MQREALRKEVPPSIFDGNTIETAACSAAIDLAEQEWYNRDNKFLFAEIPRGRKKPSP